MGDARRALITHQAYETVRAMAEQGRRASLEFGGSLLAHEGAEGAEGTLIAYAIPTGPSADQGGGHIVTDAAYQNRAIAAVRARFPSLAYVGDWHIHPMWLPRLSGTDRATAARILGDEAKRRDHLILMLGTCRENARPEVLAFHAALRDSPRVEINEVELEIVEDDSPEVRDRLGAALERIDALMAAHAAGLAQEPSEARPEPRPGSTVVHVAAARIQEELAEIRERLRAGTELVRHDELLAAIVRQGTGEAVVLFPPEYPAGAPLVFAGSLERGPLVPTPLRYGWSSLHRLVDPVTEALGAAAPATGLKPRETPRAPAGEARSSPPNGPEPARRPSAAWLLLGPLLLLILGPLAIEYSRRRAHQAVLAGDAPLNAPPVEPYDTRAPLSSPAAQGADPEPTPNESSAPSASSIEEPHAWCGVEAETTCQPTREEQP